MALFSFGDIKFLNKSNAQSSANRLTENSAYQSNIFRYPIDIGSADKGHYMVIHINEQDKTSFPSQGGNAPDRPTAIQNRLDGRTRSTGEFVGETIETVNKIINDINPLLTERTQIPLIGGDPIKFTRTIKRTTDTIALYMPDTLAFTHNQVYSDLELTGSLAAAGSAINSLVDMVKGDASNFNIKNLLGSVTPFIAQGLQSNNFLRAGFAATTGTVINPLLDLIYTAPAFREFRFDFMFYPRSEAESTQVQNIINRLYFHQAPEYGSGRDSFFLVPPSEFDIKFYYNGKINPNIPEVTTCVLTSMDVDYAPSGFSAYEVHGESVPSMGRTGMPVAIRLSLQFKETEVLTKSYFGSQTSRKYGTVAGSEQTRMLEEQERDMRG
jgi:hypothetical protein